MECGRPPPNEVRSNVVLRGLNWTKGVLVDSAKQFAVDSARGAIVDRAKTHVYEPTKGFIVDSAKSLIVEPAKGLIASLSKAGGDPPRLEDTPLYKSYRSYKAYLATNPPSYTTFRINNTALELNTSGGRRFQAELGHEDMLEVLRMAKGFIVNSLYLSGEKEVKDVTLSVENMPGVAHTQVGKHGKAEIHLSGQYVDSVARGDRAALVYEITGVLIHECTHVWQNNSCQDRGNPVLTGVIEGIADFIRLRSGYPAKNWVRGVGGVWFSGYATTAYFFDWIDRTQAPGFVNQLNFMMTKPWSVSFFDEITGKSVGHLWLAYQASL